VPAPRQRWAGRQPRLVLTRAFKYSIHKHGRTKINITRAQMHQFGDGDIMGKTL
jgi:hypothetical protein